MKLWLCLLLPAASLAAAPSLPTSLEVNSGLTPVFPFPSFDWADSTDAAHYQVQIASDSFFTTVVVDTTSQISRYARPAALGVGTYYWRVRAVDDASATSAWASGSSFAVSTPVNVVSVDPSDDAAAIQSAINAALPSGAVYVEFAPGTYDLAPPSGATYDFVLNLRYADHVWIDGNGANINITSPASGFIFLDDTTNILVEDFVIDYTPLPYAVAEITGTSNAGTGSVTMEVLPNSPRFNDAHMLASWTTWGCVLDDVVDGKLKDGSRLLQTFYTSNVTQSTSDPDVFTFALSHTNYLRFYDVGDRYIHFAREGAEPMFTSDRAKGVTFSNITNYAAPAGHYSMMWSSDVKVLNCNSLIKSGRIWGANADFVHSNSNPIGPWVEGCTVEGIGDDIVALYLKGLEITDVDDTDAHLVTIRQPSSWSVFAGDDLVLFSPTHGTVLGEYTVVTRTSLGGGLYQLQLDDEVDESGLILTGARDEVDQFFNYGMANADFAIRNNTFGPGRRHGAIIRGVNGVVEGNLFSQLGVAGVLFENEADLWYNGLYSRNIQVRNNTFLGCTYSENAIDQGSITLRISKADRSDSAAQLHQNFVIAGNDIVDWSRYAIRASNVAAVDILDNDVSSSTLTGFRVPNQDNVILEVSDADDVLIQGNDFSGETRTVDAVFAIHDATNVDNQDD
ncbi:MAG: hypothetical protein Q7P63_14210 [Verrucomicrobiota bacterium JB022]|nr:hypothetical protein [Verrucomicrobiota bacterium JB022]